MKEIFDWYLSRKEYELENNEFQNKVIIVMENDYYKHQIVKTIEPLWVGKAKIILREIILYYIFCTLFCLN